MKICFIGLGSIGTRHLKNVIDVLNEDQFDFSIDALRSKRASISDEFKEYINHEFLNEDELPSDYDVAFITNPTSLHYSTLLLMQDKAKHLFIEKPVFDSTDYDMTQLNSADRIFYVACPLRYTNVIQYLKELIRNQNVYSARVICSSYLPEWRKDLDYRQTYSASKKLGGGVSIDLIHEWDYLVYLFGCPENVRKMQGKYSNLDLDTEDIAIYIAKYPDKLVSVHLDYFGRFPRRQIELFTEEDVIIGDLVSGEVRWLNSNRLVNLKQERDEYQKKELRHFFSIVEGSSENTNSIELAVNVLRIAKDEL